MSGLDVGFRKTPRAMFRRFRMSCDFACHYSGFWRPVRIHLQNPNSQQVPCRFQAGSAGLSGVFGPRVEIVRRVAGQGGEDGAFGLYGVVFLTPESAQPSPKALAVAEKKVQLEQMTTSRAEAPP